MCHTDVSLPWTLSVTGRGNDPLDDGTFVEQCLVMEGLRGHAFAKDVTVGTCIVYNSTLEVPEDRVPA